MATPCNSCLSAVINGVRAHEHGCPDSWKDIKICCCDCNVFFVPDDKCQTICSECRNDREYAEMEDENEIEDSLNTNLQEDD